MSMASSADPRAIGRRPPDPLAVRGDCVTGLVLKLRAHAKYGAFCAVDFKEHGFASSVTGEHVGAIGFCHSDSILLFDSFPPPAIAFVNFSLKTTSSP